MPAQEPAHPVRRRRRQGTVPPPPGGRRSLIISFVIVATIAVVVVVVRGGSRPNLGNVTGADPGDAALVATGKQIYATRCASCHGPQLEGDPAWPHRQANGVMPASPLDARGPIRQHDDRWIFRTIKEGGQATAPPGYTSYMPAMGGGLSDEQIWAVIAYVRSTWPP